MYDISIHKVSSGLRLLGFSHAQGLRALTLLGSAWPARKHRTCRRFRHRARSAPLGRSKWPLEPARLCWGARNGRSKSLGSARALEIARPGCSKTSHLSTFPVSSPLGSAGALDIRARARSAPLGRPKSPLEPARLRWTGDASLGRTTNACCTQHRDEHSRAWNARVHTSIYIYIYCVYFILMKRNDKLHP
jgi:hypothetical protein